MKPSSSSIGLSVALAIMALAAPVSPQQTTGAMPPVVQDPRGNSGVLGDRRSAVLRRVIALSLEDVSFEDALREISTRAGQFVAYDETVSSVRKRVTLRASRITVGEALRRVLEDTGVEMQLSPSGQSILFKRTPVVPQPGRQTGTVTGRVSEKEANLVVVGARVAIVGSALSQTTNDDGRYTIRNVPAGQHRVRVTSVGFQPAEEAVSVPDGGTVVLNLVITRLPTKLNEVVTTATGDRRRVEVGNAIARINADSLVPTTPINTVSDLIASRAPGVQVLYSNGLTGSGSRIRIRGLNSITVSNDPIVILDGVRIDGSSGDINRTIGLGGEVPTPSRLDDLDPETIESIDILRGPSAATLYGTDAANGVIVIKTKRGQAGRTKWNISADRGIVLMPVRFPENYLSWGHSTTNRADFRCILPDAAAGRCVIDSLTNFNPLNDKETTPFKTGHQSLLGMQVSGGAEQLRYYLAGTFNTETGTVQMPRSEIARLTKLRNGDAIPDWQLHPNELTKFALRGNVSNTFGSTADVTFSSSFLRQSQRSPRNGSSGSFVRSAISGSGYRDARDGWGIEFPGDNFSQRNDQDINRVTTSVAGNWRPRAWLATRGTVGFDFTHRADNVLVRPSEGYSGGATLTLTGMHATDRSSTVLYSVDLGTSVILPLARGLSSRTSVGAQYNRLRADGIRAGGEGLSLGNETLNGAVTTSVQETRDESVTLGWYLEQTAALRERLFLTVAMRQDAGSAFGKDLKAPLYPKTSLSWLVSQEPFFPKSRVLTNVRLRAAYGHAGVQPGSTAALRLYAPGQDLVDGAITGVAFLSQIGNPDLKPERSTEFEGGVDLGLFDDRVTLEATYYRKLSRDALITRSLPPSFGVRFRQENIGSVQNLGTEVSLTARVLQTRALSWDFTLGTSVNRNKLVSLGPTVKPFGANSERFVAGYPLYGRWERPFLGYKDLNGNGIIEPNEVQVGDSLVYLGQSNPKSEVSLNNTLGLLNNRIRVSALFDYRGGALQRNTAALSKCSALSCRELNDPTAPLLLQAIAQANRRPGLRTPAGYYETGSFLRFRELSVTYDAPATVAGFLGSRTASVTLSGRNLGLYTRYRGADPEVKSAIGFSARDNVNDFGTVPQTRFWRLRVNLGR
jgi:TonB-linked SusC/RagA family outer membrane protein